MKNNRKGFFGQFSLLFKKEKEISCHRLQSLSEMAHKEPMNGNHHLRIGEIYQKEGRRENALQAYLKAAEIFCSGERFDKGAAIYKKILKQNPELEFAKVKLADTYRKMGFSGQVAASYDPPFCSDEVARPQDKPMELQGPAGELAPKKSNLDLPSFFDLAGNLEADNPLRLEISQSITMEESLSSESIFEELEKTGNMEQLGPNYNYQLGLACKEMGLMEKAGKQFQMALEKGQNPIEAARLLSQCTGGKVHSTL
jgi:tetratricopeptide (TPR) repeat protein